jgi:hypothetical protein
MVVEGRRMWQDQKVHQLYTIAMVSKNEILRQQALKFLGALERAGSEDAVWAIDDIKKNTK